MLMSINPNQHRMVFQQFNLFPHLTVLKNLTVAQTGVLGRPKDEAIGIAREMLERVGLQTRSMSIRRIWRAAAGSRSPERSA